MRRSPKRKRNRKSLYSVKEIDDIIRDELMGDDMPMKPEYLLRQLNAYAEGRALIPKDPKKAMDLVIARLKGLKKKGFVDVLSGRWKFDGWVSLEN